MQEMWQEPQVQSLGWEDALEKEMTTHSSILAWKSLDRGALWVTVHEIAKRVGPDLVTEHHQQ